MSKGGGTFKWLMIGGILAALAVGGYYLYPLYELFVAKDDNIMAMDEDDEAAVYIPTGAAPTDVADILVRDKVINDRDKFMLIADAKHYTTDKVKPGKYVFNGALTVEELVNALRSGDANYLKEVQFSTDKVHTLEQLCGKMTRNLELDSAAYLSYLTSQSTLDHYGFNRSTIICLFEPNTFQAGWAISAEDLTDLMASRFRNTWTEERKAKAKEIGLSQSEVMTLASIVYGECGDPVAHERPTVAGLYMNRLEKGMRLKADPTVKYANGLFDLQRVYNKHLKVDHPYNTYVIDGLPPGPLAPVKPEVIDDVLNYESHDYLFMCAKPGGWRVGHNFGVTAADHEKNVALYRQWQKENNIR